MKWLKFILFLAALGVGVWLLFWLIGVIYGLLWYGFWIGLFAIGGAVGYKLLIRGSQEDQPQLEGKRPIGMSEFDEADRALEEIRRKYLHDGND